MRHITVQTAARAAEYSRRCRRGTWSRGRRNFVYTASFSRSWGNEWRQTLTTTPEDVASCTVTPVRGLPAYNPTVGGTVHLWGA